MSNRKNKALIKELKETFNSIATEKREPMEPGDAGKEVAQITMRVVKEALGIKEEEKKKKD